MRTLTKMLLPLCLLLTFATAASAQPQANAASVQDFLNRAPSSTLGTPDGVPPSGETVCNGLIGAAHGLCTAYCEAMDCDSGSPQASQKACDKVGANFLKITGQAPPCDCPCVGQYPGFIEALNGPLLSCSAFSGFPFGDTVIVFTPSGFAPIATFSAGFTTCGNLGVGGGPLFITEAQARACANLIEQKAAAAGLTCGPV
jgi:hypothetical protein